MILLASWFWPLCSITTLGSRRHNSCSLNIPGPCWEWSECCSLTWIIHSLSRAAWPSHCRLLQNTAERSTKQVLCINMITQSTSAAVLLQSAALHSDWLTHLQLTKLTDSLILQTAEIIELFSCKTWPELRHLNLVVLHFMLARQRAVAFNSAITI